MSASPEDFEPRPTGRAQANPVGTQRQTRSTRQAPAPPLPSEDGPAPAPSEPVVEPPPARSARQARSRAAATPGPRAPRRLRHTVKKIDLWSALKISLCFYVCEMAVLVTAIAFLWLIADGFGVIGSVEKFIGDLLSSNDFEFLSAGMLRGTILVGLVLVAIQVVATVLACAFYNLFAELFGGLEVTVIQEDAPSKR
jgi:Transmembrane domain of unknown function (DUF3566)